jgi:glycosyltransferase involved in cell wall biosynthesis
VTQIIRHRPRVTIAIPTYNRATKTLPETLRSAAAQTYPDLEIFVSDNCSTDDTEQVVRAFGPRIGYVRQPQNLGLNGNAKACIDLARGDYLLILHDDDLIDPNFVEACIDAVAGSQHVGLIRTGVRLIDADGRVLVERPNRAKTSNSMPELMLSWFRNETSQYCCNTLYNTYALRQVGWGSRRDLFQDALAQVKVAALYGHAHVRDVKASWRRHAGNAGAASRARLDHWCDDSIELIDAICALAPERADELRREGMRFLCSMNYLQAEQSPSSWDRLLGYWLVARRFGFAASPVERLYRKDLRPKLTSAKRRVVGRLSYPH